MSLSVRTSPKAQRPPQSSRTVRAANSHAQTTGTFNSVVKKNLLLYYQRSLPEILFLRPVLAATRSPKSGSSQDTPYLDTSSVSLPAQKTSGPAPLFPVDGIVLLLISVLFKSLKSKPEQFFL